MLPPEVKSLGFTEDEWTEIQRQGFEAHELGAVLTPIYHGPTWQKDAFGRWLLPERTLGWEIAGWCAEYLRAKEGGPWTFTLEQLRFVLWWYALDEDGGFLFRTGVLQRMKGWGKDPLLAVLCLVELVGPARFSHWDAEGKPVGKQCPESWVQVTAVNQSQTRNTMRMMPSLMTDKFKAVYDVDPGAELIRAVGKTRHLEAVTSSYRALEGGRTTFTLLNETHHWVKGNNGHEMFETIDGNSTKGAEGNARYLAITNAYQPGEDSVAEKMRATFEAIREGRSDKSDFLYDTVEAHPKAPLSGPLLPRVLEKIRGDAIWLSIKSILSSISDPTIPPSRSRRMWLNQIVATEDALHGPETWDPLLEEGLELQIRDEIVLGFDGGKSDDATALVAIRLSDSAVFLLGLWEAPEVPRGPEDEAWNVDRAAVDSAVHEVFSLYTVRAFYADVALWESYIDDWAVQYGDTLGVKARMGHPIAWDMRSDIKSSTKAHERLMDAIFAKRLKHDGDLRLRRHVLNTYRRVNNHGLSFKKESRGSRRKIDAYAALMLAHEALTNYRQRGKTEKVKTRRGYFL